MSLHEGFRHTLSVLVLWCSFLALYLGGAFLLVVGVVFAGRSWWLLIPHHAGLWAVSTKTTEFFVLTVGFALILITPFLQYQAAGGGRLWREERGSGINAKEDFPISE